MKTTINISIVTRVAHMEVRLQSGLLVVEYERFFYNRGGWNLWKGPKRPICTFQYNICRRWLLSKTNAREWPPCFCSRPKEEDGCLMGLRFEEEMAKSCNNRVNRRIKNMTGCPIRLVSMQWFEFSPMYRADLFIILVIVIISSNRCSTIVLIGKHLPNIYTGECRF